MSQHFIGQVMLAGFQFAPRYFAFCNGQILSIAQNQALFSLLGTTYGGNGQTTFALPDLRGRTPVGFASSLNGGLATMSLGEQAGQEAVTLLATQLPSHLHSVGANSGTGTTRNPNNAVYATTTVPLHGPASGGLVPLNPTTVSTVGGFQAHSNMQPYTTINFCIALQGIFPSRN